MADAVRAFVRPSSTLALEGFGQRVPFAVVAEILRQSIGDLRLVRMGIDLVGDRLIGAGLVSQLTFSWAANPGYGSLHRFRDAVERDWPRPLELVEYTHGGLLAAYRAGASGLDFAVTPTSTESDLVAVSPGMALVQSPFSGRRHVAVRSVRPDVTVVHAQRADASGNVELCGIVGADKYAAYAANSVVVSVEEIVDVLSPRHGSVVLPREIVSAVVVAPRGAWPSPVQGFYERDDEAYRSWAPISADRARFQDWLAAAVTA